MSTRRAIQVQSLKNQAVIADKCEVADRYFSRLRGLIGRRGLSPGEGVYFPRNNSIHMWFMSFAIDVVFVRREPADVRREPADARREGPGRLRVTSVHRSVRPWRPLPLSDFSATDTFELPAGTIDRAAIETGDQLCTS